MGRESGEAAPRFNQTDCPPTFPTLAAFSFPLTCPERGASGVQSPLTALTPGVGWIVGASLSRAQEAAGLGASGQKPPQPWAAAVSSPSRRGSGSELGAATAGG